MGELTRHRVLLRLDGGSKFHLDTIELIMYSRSMKVKIRIGSLKIEREKEVEISEYYIPNHLNSR